MNIPVRKIVIFISIILLMVCGYSTADEISLQNGDRITGKVLNMTDEKLVIETSYAGKLKISWSEIESLVSDHEMSVLLSDGTLLTGSPLKAEKGKMVFGMGDLVDHVSFSLSDITSINPEPEGKVKIKTRVNIGYTKTEGNTEKESSHLDGEFSARTAKNRYTVGAEFNRSEDSGVESENNSMGYLQYDHFLSKKWFLYSNALFEKDEFKDFQLRSILGIGAGYQIYETPVKNLSLETGINYVNEDHIVDLDKSYTSGRWAVNYDQYFFDKAFQLFHFHEGFVSVEDTDDLFIKSRTGIRVPLFENINATLQYNVDWEKTPSPGREKTDRTIMFTLGYSLEK